MSITMEPKMKKHIVVVGNGMTSLRFCERLLEYDAFHEYRATVIGDEPVPAYDRIALSSLFEGKPETELILAEKRWYEYQKMELRPGTRITGIDRKGKSVTTQAGETIAYDRLVLATGARPHVPQIPGTNLTGVHVYRSIADTEAIRQDAANARNAVVVGGGLLGLEAAEACQIMGLNTTVVERAPHLMACQLDHAAGRLLQDKIEALGIAVRSGENITAMHGKDSVQSVQLESGDAVPADLVILATGIQPNDELGRAASLSMGKKCGIAIDKTTRTSDPDIYAIGECAAFNDTTFGLVAPCYAMAEAAAAHLGGINKTFHLSAPASQLKLLDLQVASIGNPLLDETEARHFVMQDAAEGVYKKLVTSLDGKTLLGAILIGETSEFGRLQKRIEEGSELSEHPETLLAPIGQPFEPELDMEDDDVVCFCNYVTKADICKAIDRDNLKTTGDVMGVTYAASLCGSCLDTLNTVTKWHLARH